MLDCGGFVKATLVLPVLVGIAACTPAIHTVPGVQEVSLAEVATCERRGRVTGVPGVYGPLKNVGLKDARKRALEAALNIGANRVVFDPILDEQVVTKITGDAYLCQTFSGA